MHGEVELHRRETVLVRGGLSSKTGTAVLTTERLLFVDEKFGETGGGGIVEDVLVGALQTRHEHAGPLLDLPLASIKRIARERKLFAKDRIRISTADDEYLFNEGWSEWSPILREILGTRHGGRIVEETADTWRVEPA